MCGRFVSSSPPDELARLFGAEPPAEQLVAPSWNVAPTNDVWAVLEREGQRRLEALHWGLVPRWAKDPSVGSRMINARAETLAEKNAYKAAFRSRRCIVPADGFYEWRKVPGSKVKQPYFIHAADGSPLAFAGLWEVWRPADRPDEELHSCTIVTGAPNDKVRPVHDRMPVILPPDAWSTWLDPELRDTEALGGLLVPAAADGIDLHPVSREVNQVRNKGPHLVDRLPDDEVVGAADPAGDAPVGPERTAD
jgi:putative SOS response-associated peptidase YedK